LDLLTLPKKWGVWGIKILDDFSLALAAKIGWNLIIEENT
jgi:hypothetical protein